MIAHTCTKHEPGTRQCHIAHGCECPACLQASYAYGKRVRLLALRGQTSQPACGVQRRLQALLAVGWSLVELGGRLGRSRSSMTDLLAQVDSVHWATHAAVRDLYNDLWDATPPESTTSQRRAATRARRRAQREGWAPPAAWDDGTGPHGIDNPNATPVGVRTAGANRQQYGHAGEDLVDLIERGASFGHLEAIGHRPAGIERALRRMGRADLWASLRPARLDGRDRESRAA